ncbi:MAG: type II secretion system protein [Candidatus Komeilibacteria bacterium]
MESMREYRKSVGFSLVEIILAVAILSILAGAVAYTVSNANSNFSGPTDDAMKARFAQEGYEAVKAIASDSWSDIVAASAYLTDASRSSSGKWTLIRIFSTRGTLTRNISIDDVQRDSSGAIVDSGGQPDYNTYKVTVQIVGGTSTYQLVGYITNKNAYKFRQTSWDGTTGVFSWSGNSLSNNFYSDENMTGTSTVGALTMHDGTSVAYATSSAMIISYASTSPAIKNQHILTLEWTQNVPTSCVLRLYLEATNSGSGGVPFFATSTLIGPLTASISGTATTSLNLSGYSTLSHKRWVRYGVSMRSCSSNYPTLYGVNIYAD